jgi:DNA-binding IclR family transcriptional regulator
VLAVLQAFSARRHTLTARELSRLTSIPLPSMYRYIALLRETGLLVGDDRGAYRLSARLTAMARAAEAAEPMIAVADPVMRELAAECGEPVLLVRLIARVPVCLHRVDAAPRRRAALGPGQELPLLHGASGRVLLAGLPDQQRRECLLQLAQADPAAAALLEESIARVAARGWAVSEEETSADGWAASAAVTAGRATLAALTVPSSLGRASSALQDQLVDQVRAAAARLSQLLTV